MKLAQTALVALTALIGIGHAQAAQNMKCIQLDQTEMIFEADLTLTPQGPTNVVLYGNLYANSPLTCSAAAGGASLCSSSQSKLSLLVKPNGIAEVTANGVRVQSLSCYPNNR